MDQVSAEIFQKIILVKGRWDLGVVRRKGKKREGKSSEQSLGKSAGEEKVTIAGCRNECGPVGLLEHRKRRGRGLGGQQYARQSNQLTNLGPCEHGRDPIETN